MALEDNISNIIHRKAEAEDYDHILDIDRSLYNGYDYLPHLFHEYLQDKNKWNTIVELGGKVVCI